MTKRTAVYRVPRKAATPKQPRVPNVSQAEADIDRAVETVYRIYGPDLSVFFRAIKDHLQLERRDKSDLNKPLHVGG